MDYSDSKWVWQLREISMRYALKSIKIQNIYVYRMILGLSDE
jgi:hypothetical protein